MSLTIKKVTTKRELKQFIRFANDMYADCEAYTPCLEFDELNTFDPKKNPALEHSIFQCFLAWRNGQIVGRICGIINRIANEHWQCRKARFGWFDFIDDLDVSAALLNAVAEWGRANGMDTINATP